LLRTIEILLALLKKESKLVSVRRTLVRDVSKPLKFCVYPPLRRTTMTTDILCRFDAAKQEGVVFLADTMKGNKIQAWNGTGNPVWVPLDYYHQTGPLSAADERVLMERFKQSTNRGDTVVRLRQRLPRVSRPLPNLLSGAATESVLPSVLQPASALPSIDTPPVAVAGELPSAALWRQAVADNDRLQQMQAAIGSVEEQIVSLNTQLQSFKTDYENAKVAYADLTVKYNAAIEQEAQALIKERQAALAAVGTSPVAPMPATAPIVSPRPVAKRAPARKRVAAKKSSGKAKK
jgi:hypothetical protein